MIWPELVPFVLAVVLLKVRIRNWVSNHSCPSRLRRWDVHVVPWFRGDRHWLTGVGDGKASCTCAECVSELDHFRQWVRIR